MKIVGIEAIALSAINPAGTYWGKATWGGSVADATWPAERFPDPGRMRPAYPEGIDTLLVRIDTDEGHVGWGEAKAPVAPRVAKRIVEELLAPLVLGSDPRDIEPTWERLYASMRLRGHEGGFLLEAISGIDIALWDLVGKIHGARVDHLLGGSYRSRIPVYASGIPGTRARAGEPDHDRMLHAAATAVARGFRAIKMAIGIDPESDVASVAAVRESVGNDIALYADAAGNYDVATAIRVGRALEGLGVGFLEAPLPHEHIEGYAEVARALALPIANDVITNRYQVLRFLRAGALDIVQPDVCRVGGLTEYRRIAALADAFGIACTPHVSMGAAIHFAASFHAAASTPNLVRLEYWYAENPLGDALLRRGTIAQQNGFVSVPAAPGLGVEIEETHVRAHALRDEVA